MTEQTVDPAAVSVALGLPASAPTPFVADVIAADPIPDADPTAHQTIAADLRHLARAYVAAADQAYTFAESDDWYQRASQLRLIAQLVMTSGPDSQYVAIGAAWLDAGTKLLAARAELAQQNEDEGLGDGSGDGE